MKNRSYVPFFFIIRVDVILMESFFLDFSELHKPIFYALFFFFTLLFILFVNEVGCIFMTSQKRNSIRPLLFDNTHL